MFVTTRRHVVIGGGIAGLSAARELALRGARVTLVERDRAAAPPGNGAATCAALGILTAPRGPRSALGRLSALAHRAHAALARELGEETGIDVAYRAEGSLRLERGAGAGHEAEAALRELVPGLAAEFRGATRIAEEASVDPRALAGALRASCERAGVELLEDSGDSRLRLEPVAALERERGGVIEDAVFIVTAGAWSPAVAGEAGASLAVRPIRGQALEVRLAYAGPNLRFESARWGKEYFVVPRGAGRAWIGSTVEDAGFESAATAAGADELLSAAREVFPWLSEADVVAAWAGLRPKCLRRGGPYLGRLARGLEVWTACGHYRSGILLAPISARLLVCALASDEEAMRREGFDPRDLEAFRPGR
jgi:glycine oxidase